MNIPDSVLVVIGEYYIKRSLYNRSLTATGGFGKEQILEKLTDVCRKENIVCVSSSGRFFFEEDGKVEEITEESFPGFVAEEKRVLKDRIHA